MRGALRRDGMRGAMNATSTVYGAENGRSYNGAMMAVGRKAEEIILAWLQDHGDVLEVDDWRDLRAGQRADVDCAVYYEDGTVVLAEIKNDQFLKADGNVVFEYLRINHTAPPDKACVLGWTARTPAKFILYYAPTEHAVYVFRTEVMRRVFQSFTRTGRPSRSEWMNKLARISMRWVSTDDIKSTLVVCIPLSEFPANSYKVFDVSAYERPV